MRIPSHYEKPSWQRFFAGMVIGALLSWSVFLFIYGVNQDKQSLRIKEQQNDIAELKRDKQIYQEDYKKLNKENQEKITVQSIRIKLINGKKFNLQDYMINNIERDIADDLAHILAKDLETASTSIPLMERIIEVKPFSFDDKQYKLAVTKIVITPNVYIEVKISFAK
ncbi:sporulation membrane protein YtrI [Metabacillus fastidiosus]|uniref:Sporulation protein n=1 Tax=Metabacillus fastidiosus TaxID=1458 RepID=A0ABU6NXT5_9BACI|nr:sporulation membrane protein YtrI [Metabacillus fastidiosus]MED4401192.1 sporulation protein [Metabacillus fastidiosus]MED4453230.1 sporulation protein [Metabacillus fastidiosus]MED4464119.1 sporulation protein [Metabacillus fastidiosus]